MKKGMAEWGEDEAMTGLRDGKVLDKTFVDDLDEKISNCISAFAMNTVGYYMVEFRDEVSEKFMMGFLNYRTDGFPEGRFSNYIEKMIRYSSLLFISFPSYSLTHLHSSLSHDPSSPHTTPVPTNNK